MRGEAVKGEVGSQESICSAKNRKKKGKRTIGRRKGEERRGDRSRAQRLAGPGGHGPITPIAPCLGPLH